MLWDALRTWHLGAVRVHLGWNMGQNLRIEMCTTTFLTAIMPKRRFDTLKAYATLTIEAFKHIDISRFKLTNMQHSTIEMLIHTSMTTNTPEWHY
jgi:hypothetical protein